MILDYVGIIVMAVLSGARLKQALTGDWWAVPLFTQAMLSSFLLIIHRKASRQSPLLQRLIAWISALLPLAVQIHHEIPLAARILSLAGAGLAIWTLAVLGKSFDVTPMDRGLVKRGPYKLVRHPMYSSELFSVLMIVLMDLSLRNILVTLALAASLVLRIFWEEKIIQGYAEYSTQVRNRLLPGVW